MPEMQSTELSTEHLKHFPSQIVQGQTDRQDKTGNSISIPQLLYKILTLPSRQGYSGHFSFPTTNSGCLSGKACAWAHHFPFLLRQNEERERWQWHTSYFCEKAICVKCPRKGAGWFPSVHQLSRISSEHQQKSPGNIYFTSKTLAFTPLKHPSSPKSTFPSLKKQGLQYSI